MRLWTFGVGLVLSGCWSDDQVTLVHCAANASTSCVRELLLNGASANGHGKEGESPYFVAVQKGHYETADLFLQFGASPSGSHMGRSYVMIAIEERDVETLRYLKVAGADLSAGTAAYAAAREANDVEVLALFED